MSERPEGPRDTPAPTPVLVEPSEKRNGLVFPGCDIKGRFKGDAGRGIFDGDKEAALDEPPAPVDVDAVDSPVVAALPVVDGFPLRNT